MGTHGPLKGAAGYSGTPLWKKLGYRDGTAAYVEGAPAGYASLLALPRGTRVEWLALAAPGMRFVHVFATRAPALGATLRTLRRTIASDGVIWVSWPKRSSGVATDITEDRIRDLALPAGLADIKVCAVDGVWSGLKLMVRREER